MTEHLPTPPHGLGFQYEQFTRSIARRTKGAHADDEFAPSPEAVAVIYGDKSVHGRVVSLLTDVAQRAKHLQLIDVEEDR